MRQILKEFYLQYYLRISVPWRISIFMLIILLSAIMFTHYKRELINKNRAVSAVILISWIWFVIISTVLGRACKYDTYQYNLELFWELKSILSADTIAVKMANVRGIVYNILMLMPVGVLMPIVFCTDKWSVPILTGVFLSNMIEILQLFTRRGLFEFDDIFNNTLGVIIGYLIYRLMHRLFIRIANQC